jgi:NDP-sugar pyrophosphorylase family protein
MLNNINPFNINVIIPLGGKGERFQKEGYNKPKPLMNIMPIYQTH